MFSVYTFVLQTRYSNSQPRIRTSLLASQPGPRAGEFTVERKFSFILFLGLRQNKFFALLSYGNGHRKTYLLYFSYFLVNSGQQAISIYCLPSGHPRPGPLYLKHGSVHALLTSLFIPMLHLVFVFFYIIKISINVKKKHILPIKKKKSYKEFTPDETF